MKLQERIAKIETELRMLCEKMKGELDLKTFKRILVKELRQNGYLACERWEQGAATIPILAWKHGLAVAIQFRHNNDHIQFIVDELQTVIHEKDPQRTVIRAVINLEPSVSDEEQEIIRMAGILWIVPGDLTVQTPPEPVGVNTQQDKELPF